MYKLLLCTRYLRTRYIALASIISVTLGVATMIVVNSVMAGFSTQMRERIHGLLADVIVETRSLDGVPNPELLFAMARDAAGDQIDGMTATVEIYGMLSFKYAGDWVTQPVTLIGIEPEGKAEVGPLIDYLDSYNPVIQNGRKVREPLRSKEEPPSWKLTDKARQHREDLFEQQAWLRQRIQHGGGDEFLPPSPGSSSAGLIQPVGAEIDSKAAPPSFEEFESSSGTANAAPPEFLQPSAPVTPVDPAEPLEGRVYIGMGLISYPYEDRDTGEVRTMMMKQPGDDVQLTTVTAARPPEACHFNATVVDVFKSGMSEYDSGLVFCNLEYLQQVRGMVDPESGERAVTALQLKLKDFNRADEVVQRLRAIFPPGIYNVRTWEQKQGPLLAAVEVESMILNVLLFLIIAVAGFGILAIFFMIVVEKTRDIGVLKALGASSNGVMTIFLSYGLGLGLVGAGVGTIFGLLFVHYINEISDFLALVTGRDVFPETIYYFPEIPTAVSPLMLLWVGMGAVAIAVLASILPARRAAALHPVEALRYE
ncbi:ABC transporter permease [Calycomorphotria hydatis]|uniref:Lipoprotein-releasing system transmembrane protein LolC n=1 Tax=Calycomorphotria hydatis TaxID=2528027 RepID=A0A517TAY4_9PLAN|nr:FtsX-like permease family protein [Calycomorphotria hydatis]QDT65537.1 Lipoprotein-releasing system transmembrane protein LolC [Calycomorphotria hydatis]